MLMIAPRFVLLDDFLRLHKLGRNGESKFQHGFVSGGSGFLGKKSDRCLLLDRNRTAIRRNVPKEKRKQGRFPSAIRADQSDPIAAIHLERYVIEERPAGERF